MRRFWGKNGRVAACQYQRTTTFESYVKVFIDVPLR
jgi:hypothetical protein